MTETEFYTDADAISDSLPPLSGTAPTRVVWLRRLLLPYLARVQPWLKVAIFFP